LAELTAYYHGEGTPEARAAFEKHLADCPECQAALARLREMIPKVSARLREPLDNSVDAMMHLMERAERDLEADRAHRLEASARRRPLIFAVAALAAVVMASLLLLLMSSLLHPETQTAPPRPPAIDGG
jgi:anti-sigma factor RsiW